MSNPVGIASELKEELQEHISCRMHICVRRGSTFSTANASGNAPSAADEGILLHGGGGGRKTGC